MRSKYFFWMTIVVLCVAPFAFASAAAVPTINLGEQGFVEDDETPAVTARVARVSFIRGDARIKRSDVDDWETMTLNLPLVEGDSISTSAGSRIEIQFDTRTHLRLDEEALVRLTKLGNDGIAISISEGSASLRLLEFDRSRGYFEVDAPSTTIAIQRSGLYRVDTGRHGDQEIRLTALDSGEARVYSESSGFTLKNGRMVRVFIAGDRAGEWDTNKAAAIADAFDTWALERDEVIARRLQDAHYDTYYDRDIYAADELTEHGTWIHTRKYGYVWRPSRQATSIYADWSPYRYGSWRWVPYYGWTWVNDEPWGWATYHHGRWFYDGGFWHWSPYSYYRHTRSWWRPALVIFASFGNSYCWYPLPYHYAYYNYNNTVINNTTIINNTTVVNNPYGIKTTPPGGGVTPATPTNIAKVRQPPPLEIVPTSAVVAVAKSDFGRAMKGNKAPLATAQAVLASVPNDKQIVKLPPVRDVHAQPSSTIKTMEPVSVRRAPLGQIGAAVRTKEAPLDDTLRTQRIFGNRAPVKSPEVNTGRENVRSTGAVDRLPESAPVRPSPSDGPITRKPRESAPPLAQPPVRDREEAPVRQAPPTQRYEPPVRQPPVRQPEPPRERERPRDNPPPVRQPDPPRERPRDNPPPAPVRESPKHEAPPAPLERSPDRKKPGR